jgi:hypothetical protein
MAILRLFGLWTLLLTSSQIAHVAAYGNETDVVDLLKAGRIRTSATWCYKKPGPERCAGTLRMKDGSLIFEGVGCGSFRVPVNGSNGRQAARITGNTITVSVTGHNGTGVNTYELSTDLTKCTHTVECPAGFQAKVFSCSVDRNMPTQALSEQGSSDKAVAKKGEPNPPAPATTKDAASDAHMQPSSSCSDLTAVGGSTPSDCLPPIGAQNSHAQPIDAQSYMEAAKDLKEREPNYNSLSAAVQTFRRAAAAFQAAGDIARAQAATDEAQALENAIKIADRRVRETQNPCGVLRGNALQCYMRATRPPKSPLSEATPAAGQVGALLDCVEAYCSAMQTANCPMPMFGKDNAGFCFTTATDDPDFVRKKSSAPR